MSVRTISYYCGNHGKRKWARFHCFAQREGKPVAILEYPDGRVFTYSWLEELRFHDVGFATRASNPVPGQCDACVILGKDTGAAELGLPIEHSCSLPRGHAGNHKTSTYNRYFQDAGYGWLDPKDGE